MFVSFALVTYWCNRCHSAILGGMLLIIVCEILKSHGALGPSSGSSLYICADIQPIMYCLGVPRRDVVLHSEVLKYLSMYPFATEQPRIYSS